MTSHNRAEVISKVIAASTFPKVAKLKDQTCYVCQEATLIEGGRETPIKLKCGHVFGMTCLLAWNFEEFRRHSDPTCPYCRKPLLEGSADQPAALEASTPDEDDEDLIDWIQELASWIPGDSVNVDKRWIRFAEQLWKEICDKMLDYIEDLEYFGSRSLSGEIEYFLCTLIPPIEGFLSYGTVYAFYIAYTRPGYTVDRLIETQFRMPYRWLANFLRKCTLDEASWRVYSAFHGAESRVDEFRRRIGWTRAVLSERIEVGRRARRISGRRVAN
ncbi:MAG: hypothetical protein L6R42_007139 [Xanthoria sp. 1 TBL-2021]|nr:MAG: hypothetical protein L6R42_007139 [Xanthoria sp. 1 TBL-2021]